MRRALPVLAQPAGQRAVVARTVEVAGVTGAVRVHSVDFAFVRLRPSSNRFVSRVFPPSVLALLSIFPEFSKAVDILYSPRAIPFASVETL